MSYELIKYNDKLLTLYSIARTENIPYVTLRRYYKMTGDIYESIRFSNENRGKKGRKIGTKNQEIKNVELADEHKDIFMKKYIQRKNQSVYFKCATISLYEMSILIGVRYEHLINLLNEGLKIDEIKEKYQTQQPSENIKLKNGQTLLEFCLERKIDFSFFYRAIVTYRKSLSEVLKQSKCNNNQIPINWIYEKYGDVFKQLELNDAQVAAIIYSLKIKKLTLDEAMEECIIRKNARKIGIPDEWGESLFSLIKMRKLVGEQFHKEITIDIDEIVFLDACIAEKVELRTKLQNSSKMTTKKRKKQEDITHD